MDKSKDPIYEEYQFCKDCEPKLESLVTYIRALENAQIAAKDALETMTRALDKLTVEKKILEKQCVKQEERLKGKSAGAIKKKMKELDNAHQRFLNRGRLIQ